MQDKTDDQNFEGYLYSLPVSIGIIKVHIVATEWRHFLVFADIQ